MRAFTITIFLMMFFLGMSLVNNLELFNSGVVYGADVSSKINTTYMNLNTSIESTEGGTDVFGFLTVWTYVRMFWNTLKDFFGYTLFLAPFLINELGLPTVIAGPMQVFIYLIYVLTFFEFATQRRLDYA